MSSFDYSSSNIVFALDWETEREISSGKIVSHNARCDYQVLQEIKKRARSCSVIAVGRGWKADFKRITDQRPDVVVNLAFSATPEEAQFVAALSYMGIRFTGSDAIAIGVANNKAISRSVLLHAGMPIPHFVHLGPKDLKTLSAGEHSALAGLRPPLIVRPVFSAGSRSVCNASVVNSFPEIADQVRRVHKLTGESSVCDEYVDGREFKATFVEQRNGNFRFAGASEWIFPKGFLRLKTQRLRASSAAKKKVGIRVRPAAIDKVLEARVGSIGNAALKKLGIRGYASVDLRVDSLEHVWIVEVNANPGLSCDLGHFCKPSFSTNLQRIMQAAFLEDQAQSDR